MTLDTLLGFNAEQFKTLTDFQLEELCSPYFNITRPELAHKERSTKPTLLKGTLSPEEKDKADKMKLARQLMAKHGIFNI